VAADPDFRARVELADRLGVPPSQLDGREPAEVTEHEYDAAGRLIRSTTNRESRFTEADRAELLALAAYRAGLCPVCGGPLDVCTSHEATGPKFVASRVRCRRTDAVIVARDALQNTQRPEALVWSTTTHPRR
jgi:hypothetical protein